MNTIALTRGVPADESYPLEQLGECAAAVMHDPKLALEAMRYGLRLRAAARAVISTAWF